MRNFKKLDIWQVGFQIALNSFKITESFSKYHQWSIGLQINKSGVSIPSNVAEGNSRSSEKDKKRFIEISEGSSFELETQLLLAQALKIGNQELITATLSLIAKEQSMLFSFKNVLNCE